MKVYNPNSSNLCSELVSQAKFIKKCVLLLLLDLNVNDLSAYVRSWWAGNPRNSFENISFFCYPYTDSVKSIINKSNIFPLYMSKVMLCFIYSWVQAELDHFSQKNVKHWSVLGYSLTSCSSASNIDKEAKKVKWCTQMSRETLSKSTKRGAVKIGFKILYWRCVFCAKSGIP